MTASSSASSTSPSIGGGDSAIEEATFLSRFGSKVTLIHRREELRASKIMQERAFADPKIDFAWNSEVTEIHGDDKLTGLTLRDTVTGETRHLDATGLFIAIGHDPRSELLPGQVDLDAEGYVLVDHPSTHTNLAGVFASGDLVDHHYRQAITAAGTGCAAALDAERYLAELDHARQDGRHGDRCRRQRLSAETLPRAGTNWPARGVHYTASPSDHATHRGEQMSNLQAVTDDSFETDVLKSDKPVLVDFWAEWCGPCRQVGPILDELAAEHGEKVTFVKMNVDENPVTPSTYRVNGIPTLNVYKDGEVVKQIVGARPKAALLKELADFIA